MKTCGPTVQMSKLMLAGSERTWACPEEWVFALCAKVAIARGRDRAWRDLCSASPPSALSTLSNLPGPVQPLRAQADSCSSAPAGVPFSPSFRQVPLPSRRPSPYLQAGKPICGLPWLYPAVTLEASLSSRGSRGIPFITRPCTEQRLWPPA